jgi:uncharacterized protein (TIGR02996 family)
MSASNPFLAAILQDPTDDGARQGCADWLQEDGGSPIWGRFIAASLVLARYRNIRLPVVDPEYPRAVAELDATALTVVQQMSRAIGLRAEGERWIWDAKDDAVTGLEVPPKGHKSRGLGRGIMLRRGLLSGVLASLRWCLDLFDKTLTRCPLEKVEVLDVPGLVFDVAILGDGHWELKSTLSVRPQVVGRDNGPFYMMPADRWTWGREYKTRDDLVVDAAHAIPEMIERIQRMAGERWPGPREDEGS